MTTASTAGSFGNECSTRVSVAFVRPSLTRVSVASVALRFGCPVGNRACVPGHSAGEMGLTARSGHPFPPGGPFISHALRPAASHFAFSSLRTGISLDLPGAERCPALSGGRRCRRVSSNPEGETCAECGFAACPCGRCGRERARQSRRRRSENSRRPDWASECPRSGRSSRKEEPSRDGIRGHVSSRDTRGERRAGWAEWVARVPARLGAR